MAVTNSIIKVDLAYMTIADAHRVVKQVLGGHSLKIHDGAFLETCREDEIKQNFRGARFLL